MSARTATIEALLATLARFVRDEQRLLQILVDVELRKSVVALVTAQEHRPDNHRPLVLFVHEHTIAAPGWTQRAEAARTIHAHRRDGEEKAIPALGAAPTGADARLVFALQLQQLLLAAPPNTEGLVVVLAPGHVEAPAKLREAVELLVSRRELATVKWIVIEADGDALGATVTAAGSAATRFDARLPPAAAGSELDALLADHPPAAPKGVTPPPRPDVPDRTPDADGLRRREIGRLSLAAAIASSRGQGAQAVAAQRSARDLCAQAGWTSEAVTMELALGGHLVAAGATRDAEVTFGRAIETAKQHGMHDKAATAGFGLAATRTVRGERHTALVAYADAALAAERSGSVMLAIEASRLAGQAALELRMEPQAITFFAKAVQLAEAAPASEGATHSSAAVAARTLADLCRKRGLHERAAALSAQADALAKQAPPEIASATVAPPAPAPIIVQAVPAAGPATPAAFVPFDEGTSMLTLDQIARVHMRGTADDATPPAQGARSWTRDEIDSLQRAVDHSIGDDASRILSVDELAALRGRVVVRDDALPVPPPLLPEGSA